MTLSGRPASFPKSESRAAIESRLSAVTKNLSGWPGQSFWWKTWAKSHDIAEPRVGNTPEDYRVRAVVA